MQEKIRKELQNIRKKSYADACALLPGEGIDCSEGCSPFGYPRKLRTVFERFDPDRFSPYPHSMAAYEGIRSFWRDQCDLKKENIMLTDGSICAIYIVNNIFNVPGAKVLGLAPQFAGYVSNVRLLGMEYIPVFLKRENQFEITPKDLEEKINDEISLVYIDNPNNPTGQIIEPEDLERILKKAKEHSVCVIVDEAYGDFIPKEKSAVRFLDKYENLIIIRTLSKGFGLAGIRAGYILASENLIRYMGKVSNPYQMGEIVREFVGAVLEGENDISSHMKSFAEEKQKIRESIGRNLMMAKTCDTVSVCMLYHRDRETDLRRLFYENGVLTVPGTEFDGLNSSYVRVRLPRPEEFPLLLKAVKNINEGQRI